MPRQMLSAVALLFALATAARAETPSTTAPPPPAPPVTVVTIDPALQAWQVEVEPFMAATQTQATVQLRIPPGFTLVIENVSGFVNSDWTNQLELELVTFLEPNHQISHFIPLPRAFTPTFSGYMAAYSQPTRIYARDVGASTVISVISRRHGPSDQQAAVAVTLSGRLVPNP